MNCCIQIQRLFNASLISRVIFQRCDVVPFVGKEAEDSTGLVDILAEILVNVAFIIWLDSGELFTHHVEMFGKKLLNVVHVVDQECEGFESFETVLELGEFVEA